MAHVEVLVSGYLICALPDLFAFDLDYEGCDTFLSQPPLQLQLQLQQYSIVTDCADIGMWSRWCPFPITGMSLVVEEFASSCTTSTTSKVSVVRGSMPVCRYAVHENWAGFERRVLS